MLVPMAQRMTIGELLAAARRRFTRLRADAAHEAMRNGAVLIDIRSREQRRADGVIPGSIWIPRNVLEWRVDPTSGFADPAVADPDRVILLLCAQGFQTSLAVCTLLDLGFRHATDVVDGFEGWRAAGLPIGRFRPGQHDRTGSS